eukprot:m.140364 g.140364  ORF g.140364 m.140364 type:complete len:63 (+) comp14033_c0_seq1:381-569(+)
MHGQKMLLPIDFHPPDDIYAVCNGDRYSRQCSLRVVPIIFAVGTVVCALFCAWKIQPQRKQR